jgi:hypothetical protein
MAKKIQKSYIFLGITVLVLATLACGSVQVGVITPTAEGEVQPVEENPEPDSKLTTVEETESPAEEVPTPEPDQETPEPQTTIIVTAWMGHIASLPEGSQFDDMVVLSPEGTGEFGLAGATPEIEAEIRTLRDSEGPNKYVHLWGMLSCDVEDYNGCQLLVDKLQYGATQTEEDIEGWLGIITSSTNQGGPSHVFELSGEYPMWYSIHASQDESLQAQIESLRDTGAVVQVSGKLLVGFPDVNGTRIEVSKLEVVEAGTEEQPDLDTFDPTVDWPIFISDRYNYQIKYPANATISLFGPVGFSMEDKPEDMTPDQYTDSLLKEYTDQLCVKIEYSLGWIYIAAPPNKDKVLNPCGPTGLGSGEIIDKIETITVGDELYQANGVEFKLQVADSAGNPFTGETLDLHGEMFRIELEDSTVIRFGTQPRHDATYEDYLMKTKEMLLQIIATYEALP